MHDCYIRSHGLKPFGTLLFVTVLATSGAAAQDSAPPALLVEAESGSLGSEFEVDSAGDAAYITITTDYNVTTGDTDHPGANRTASYEVTFPDSGEYALYARIYVGPDNYDDDSFFSPAGFGEHDPAAPAGWLLVNGLAGVGYTGASTYVESEGTAQSEVWKWLRVTGFAAPAGTYVVPADTLVQTFVIGGREDGLRIDKFAFAPTGAFYTVQNLDNGEPGVNEIPEIGSTLTVDLSSILRPVTHVASGALYGVTTSMPLSLEDMVAPLSPRMYTQPARGGAGYQQPYPADAIPVAQRLATATDAEVTIRLADINPNFPYTWVGAARWTAEVTALIREKLAYGFDNIYGYEIWNEQHGTWNAGANGGDFFSTLWKPTYDLIRSLDPDEPIIGPSDSYYSTSRIEAFLKYCVANDCLPDVIAWHELGGSANVSANIDSYRSLERSLRISPRAISINEYSDSVHENEGAPGASAPFIAKFERKGVETANISWWFPQLVGRLGSLLTANNERGGGWWFYKWYGDMSGDMVKVTPPDENSDGIDGFANLDMDAKFASVCLGGNYTGNVDVVFNGIPEEFGHDVDVRIEYVEWEGKDIAVPLPTTVSVTAYDASAGTITVPVDVTDPLYGYRVSVVPAGQFTAVSDDYGANRFALKPNYPNPFTGETEIAYSVSTPGWVHLEVFNAIGQRVAVLVNESRPAGSHVVSFRGTELPPGLYFYRLNTKDKVATRTMTLVR